MIDTLDREKEDAFLAIVHSGQVYSVYQPILDFRTLEIIAYEALSRGPVGSGFESPLVLLEYGHHLNCLWELEQLFREKALENAAGLLAGQKMFINVDPDSIKDPNFQIGMTQEALKRHGIAIQAIAFEITERTAIHDYETFVEVLNHYRRQGYSVAIDDAGAGYSGLKSILEIRPDYIKLDMDLIRDIDKDAFKQSLIRAFVESVSGTGLQLIAEGIETEEELKTLMVIGVHAGQGYFIGKPMPSFSKPSEHVMKRVGEYSALSKNLTHYTQDYHFITHLIDSNHPTKTFDRTTRCLAIQEYMSYGREKSVVVTEANRPVGLVTRAVLNDKLSGQYGYVLYMNKEITTVMKKNPLIIDAYTPIHMAAKKAMERCDEDLYDDLIIVKGNEFIGLVTMKRVIEYTLVFEKHAAKELNPLSGLPGNPIINRVLSDIISYTTHVGVFYIDINDFKVYNDLYGFERGDQMILLLTDILREVVKSSYPYNSFIGHIGGDDFIILIEGRYDDCINCANEILSTFNERRLTLFTEEHCCYGLECEDRFGVKRSFPLNSLTVAGIHGNLAGFKSIAQFSEALGYQKNKAKKNRDRPIHLLEIVS
jgi:EAL domain-containing protein (putative c-di-GMP-specific phosphodiesterase class I)/GGDEF domain-containing protein